MTTEFNAKLVEYSYDTTLRSLVVTFRSVGKVSDDTLTQLLDMIQKDETLAVGVGSDGSLSIKSGV